MCDEECSGLTVAFVSQMIYEKSSVTTKLDKPRGGEVILFKAEEAGSLRVYISSFGNVILH
jgi:hypothetical protein